MKEAFGGIFTMQALVIFLVLASGLLAFSVSYTKSFKVKNDIRRIIEQYEGLTEDAELKIDSVAEKYNYHVSNPTVYSDVCTSLGKEWRAYKSTLKNGNNVVFCYKCDLLNVKGENTTNDTYKGSYYTIVTFVNIDIPIINRIFPKAASFLQIKGETALIYSSGNNSEVCKFNN